MAMDQASGKPRLDLLKPTEQHEGLPGYLEEPTNTANVTFPRDPPSLNKISRPTPAKRHGKKSRK